MSNDPIRSRPSALPGVPLASAAAPAAKTAPVANAVGVPADQLVASAAGPTAAIPTAEVSAHHLLGEALSGAPALQGPYAALNALQARRSELVAELAGTEKDLKGWRDLHGGFDSMARVGAGIGKAVSNLAHGEFAFWKGTGEAITDAETLEKAPQRARIAELKRQLSEVDAAVSALADGRAPAGAKDYAIAEAAALAAGKPFSLEQVLQHRLGFLKAAASEGKAEATASTYPAALEPYLTVAGASGESVEQLKSGQPSVTGTLNQLIAIGVVDTGGKRVATSGDLKEVVEKLKDARKDEKNLKNEKVKALLGQLSDGAISQEAGRLAALEKGQPHAALRKYVDQANAQLGVLEQKTGKSLIASLGEGIAHVLDDPQTWAMIAAGGIATKASSLLLRGAAVSPAELFLARSSGQISRAMIGKAVATAGVQGVGFQLGMNGFNHARGKEEHAGWGATDFLRSILLFETLGAVKFNALRRAPAITALGKTAQGARYFGEEAAALTGLGVGEAFLRDGDLKSAGQIFQANFEFLIAMRMVGFAQGRFAGKERELGQLRMQEARVRAAQTRYETDRTPANLQAAYAELRAYSVGFHKLTRGFVERGLTDKQQQTLKSATKFAPDAEFRATLAAAKAQGLAAAKTPAERAAVEARYAEIEATSVAFFDNSTGFTIVNSARLQEPNADAVLRHEYTHQAIASLPAAEQAALTAAFTSAPDWKSLKASVKLKGASDAVVVGELVARWNGATAATAGAESVQRTNRVMQGAGALGASVDLRSLSAAEVASKFSGVPYTNLSGDADAVGFSIPDYSGPEQFNFPGAGLFLEKGASVGGASADAQRVYQALFRGGREDLVSLYKAMALADPTTRLAILGTLNSYGDGALFIPGKTPEFYLERLVSAPFFAATPEVRATLIDAINLKTQSRSNQIKAALVEDNARPNNDRKGVWDAVLVGAGPHTQAAARAIRETNPNARILVVEAGSTVSQFSETGDAFYVNSGAYQDTGAPARPSAGVGDLNPLDGPVLVTDGQSLKYAKGRDIGDASAVNLERTMGAGPGANGVDVLVTSELIDGGVRKVDPSEGLPGKYELVVNAQLPGGTTQQVRLYANKGVIGTGISGLDVSRFDPDSAEYILSKINDTSDAARIDGNVLTSQQLLGLFGTEGDPQRRFRGKKNMVVGFGDSGFVTVAALKGALSAPDIAARTFSRRQLGDVGPVEFVTGKSGPNDQFEFSRLFELNEEQIKRQAEAFGYRVEVEKVDPPEGSPAGTPKVIRFRYIDLGGLARERANDVDFNAANLVSVRRSPRNAAQTEVLLDVKDGANKLEEYLDSQQRLPANGELFTDPETGVSYTAYEVPDLRVEPVVVDGVEQPRPNRVVATNAEQTATQLESYRLQNPGQRPELDGQNFIDDPSPTNSGGTGRVLSYVTTDAGPKVLDVTQSNAAINQFTAQNGRAPVAGEQQAIGGSTYTAVRRVSTGEIIMVDDVYEAAALARFAENFPPTPPDGLAFNGGEFRVVNGEPIFVAATEGEQALQRFFEASRPTEESVLARGEFVLREPAADLPGAVAKDRTFIIRENEVPNPEYVADANGAFPAGVPATVTERQFLQREDVDNLILATGPKTNTAQLLSSLPELQGVDVAQPLERNDEVAKVIQGQVAGFDEPVNIGRQVGEDWLLVGPATGDIVPKESLANQKENVASLFNLIPRSSAVGRLVGTQVAQNPVGPGLQFLLRSPDSPFIPVFNQQTELRNESEARINLPAETPLERIEQRPPTGFEEFRLKYNLAALLAPINYPQYPNGADMRVTVSREDGQLVFKSKNLDANATQQLANLVNANPTLRNLLRDMTLVNGQSIQFNAYIGPDGKVAPERLSVAPVNEWNFFR